MAKITARFVGDMLYRGYNAAVFAGVAYNLYNNPERFYELLPESIPDMAIHGVEALFPNTLNPLMLGANMLRGGQAAYAYATGYTGLPHMVSAIPRVLNGADVFNHAMNVMRRLYNIRQTTSETGTDVTATQPVKGWFSSWRGGAKTQRSLKMERSQVLTPKQGQLPVIEQTLADEASEVDSVDAKVKAEPKSKSRRRRAGNGQK